MSEQGKSLLVVKSEKGLTKDMYQALVATLTPVADRAGLVPVVLDDGLDAGIHADIAPMLRDLLTEQKQTNQLLMLLIQALADETDPDVEPTHYMDGTPIVPTLSGK